MIAVISFLTLSCFIPAWFLLSSPTAEFSAGATPALFLVIYSAARLSMLSAQSSAKLTQVTFWVFVYVFLALCPLLQITYARWPWPYAYETETLIRAYLVVLLGVAAYEMGLRAGVSGASHKTLGSFLFLGRQISYSRIVVTTIVTILALPLLIQDTGGLAILFASRNDRYDALVEATAGDSLARLQFTYLLIAVVPMVCMFGLLQFSLRVRSQQAMAGPVHWTLLVVAILIAVVVNNPASTPRYMVGMLVLAVLFIVVFARRSKLGWLPVVIVLALLFIFPIADAFRVSLDPSDSIYYAERTLALLTDKPDYDAFQQILNAVSYVTERGITWGNQILGTLGFWIPRNVWPEKAVSSGTLLAEYKAYEYTNLSLPLWGELFLDGSFMFVAIGMGLYGWITGRVETFAAKQVQVMNHVALGELLLVIFAAYQIFLLRGSLLPAFAYLTPIVLLVALWSRSSTKTIVSTSRQRIHPALADNSGHEPIRPG